MKNSEIFRFGEFEVDSLSRTVRRRDFNLTLNRRAFDVLLYFVRNPGKVLSKDELLKNVWPDAFVDSNSLTQSICVLRKALAEKPGDSQYIVTLAGRGYQFVSPVIVPHVAESATCNIVDSSSLTPSPVVGLFLQQRTIRTSVVTEESARWNPSPGMNRFSLALGSLALLVLASLAGVVAWKRLHPPPSIPVVLADFQTTAGDPDFDRALKQALQFDLEQSPFLNLLSRSKLEETLTEMQRKGDDPLTPALAREVCERNSAQAVLHGSISNFGNQILLILSADSCVSGKPLAGYKSAVSSKQALLVELDKAAGSVRRQLGESAASLERYQIPITSATTPSLDALRAFSQAGESFWHGDMKGAQVLLNRAVTLDPDFASAYRALGSTYYNLGDFAQASVWYRKAFDLRGRTTERERLGIEAMYYGYALNDYEESIRRTRESLAIYPNITNSWVSLSNLYSMLGQYPQAIDAAEHAYRLDPHSSVATVELARSCLRAGRFDEARQIATTAVAEGKDHWDFHSILFQIAFARHDEAAMKAESEWGLTRQHANTSLYDLAFAAAASGKVREASEAFARSRSEALREGETDFANGVLIHSARVLTALDKPDLASANLKQLTGKAGDPASSGEVALAKAMMGDIGFAQRFIAAAGSADDRNTVEIQVFVPMVRAYLALKAHKPADAVRLLESARAYQLRDFSVPFLRAEAETEAGMLEAAAEDYSLILQNQGVNAIAPEYPLAHLGLARVLVLEKKPASARKEYQAFFDAWKNADPDLRPFKEARREFAQLQ